jgi:hypothetical protein
MKDIIKRVIRYLSRLLFLLSLFAPHAVFAQADGDDAYDPFADYSEFDEASDEEADINFFRNGRFFTIGFAGGVRNFTGNLGKIYGSAPSYGLYMAYFFDLRMALQFSFLTGDHGLEFKDPQETIVGTVSFTLINIDMKYYLSSQNVTRGLADKVASRRFIARSRFLVIQIQVATLSLDLILVAESKSPSSEKNPTSAFKRCIIILHSRMKISSFICPWLTSTPRSNPMATAMI